MRLISRTPLRDPYSSLSVDAVPGQPVPFVSAAGSRRQEQSPRDDAKRSKFKAITGRGEEGALFIGVSARARLSTLK